MARSLRRASRLVPTARSRSARNDVNASAVLISLVVSVLVIPSFAARWLTDQPGEGGVLAGLGAQGRAGIEWIAGTLVRTPLVGAGLVGSASSLRRSSPMPKLVISGLNACPTFE